MSGGLCPTISKLEAMTELGSVCVFVRVCL